VIDVEFWGSTVNLTQSFASSPGGGRQDRGAFEGPFSFLGETMKAKFLILILFL
jgi:hypothetical protein